MKKPLSLLLVLILVLTMLAGCGKNQQPAPVTEPAPAAESAPEAPAETEVVPEEVAEPVTLTMSVAGAETGAASEAFIAMADKVNELSGGNLQIEIFFNSILYTAEQAPSAVLAGDIDMCPATASLLTDGSPWLDMFAAGYIIKDYEQFDAVYNGEIGEEIAKRVADEQGLLLLGTVFQGARQISLIEDKEIKTPEDLKGYTLRMPGTDSYVFLGEALGANVTPIALNELYTALQTGVVDGQDNPLSTTKAQKFDEVLKSITITNHYMNYTWVSIGQAQWDALSEQQQEWLKEAAAYGCEIGNQISLNDEATLISEFEAEGLKIYYADLDAFSEHVLSLYLENEDATKNWDMDLYERVVALG